MKRRNFYAVLMIATMVFVGGCGEQTETNKNTEDTVVESTVENTENTMEDTETVESVETIVSDEEQDLNSVITEKEDSELDLKEYYYSFEDRTLCKGDDVFFNIGTFESAGDETYYLSTGKIPLYASNGVRIGYTKEDVRISVFETCEDWCWFYLGSDRRFARLSDIEANALNPEEIEAMKAEKVQAKADKEAQAQTETQPQSQSTTPVEQTSTQETVPNTAVEEPVEVPATSDKYTPEEAIAIYRGIMEDGGIIWSPELKDVTSWGTGFFYLDKKPLEWAGGKSYIEWAGHSSLESFEFGHNFDGSWTKYYLEVTGSDDECVYITEWHN